MVVLTDTAESVYDPTGTLSLSRMQAYHMEVEQLASTAMLGTAFDSLDDFRAATIPATFSSVTVRGDYAYPVTYDRVESEPDHPFKARSTDRYLPDGNVSSDGGWWQQRGMAVRPLMIVATGQSNMLGISTSAGGDRSCEPGVAIWEQFPASDQTTGWKEAGPDQTDWPFRSTNTNSGIWYTFARLLRRSTGRPVAVVMYASGGRPIAEWRPGGGGVTGATGAVRISLWAAYEDAVASAWAVAHGLTSADVILWHQGEADNDDNVNSGGAQWAARFAAVLGQMREPETSFGDVVMARADTPILVGRLLEGGTEGGAVGVGPTTDDRNTEISALDYSDDAYVMSVSSKGMRSADNIHIIASDLEVFATRYFAAYNQLPKRVISSASVPATLTSKTLVSPTMTGTPKLGAGYTTDGTTIGSTWASGTMRSSFNAATLKYHYQFFNPNGSVGSITTTDSATAFTTTSDENLKAKIGDYAASDALAVIRADPAWSFAWRVDGIRAVGWGAQTSYAVSPDLAVPGGWRDPETGADVAEGTEGAVYHPWGVDQGKRTPYLWAAIGAPGGLADRLDAVERVLQALMERIAAT